MVFDGNRYGNLSSTWLYGSLTRADAQTIGTPCNGTTRPVLTSGAPRLGARGFYLDLLHAPPTAPYLFGLSAGTQVTPVGPCSVYLAAPIIPMIGVTNAGGFASSRQFSLPLDPSLRGITIYAQAFVADPGGPIAGHALTAGLRLVVGD